MTILEKIAAALSLVTGLAIITGCGGDAFTAGAGDVDGAHVLVDGADEVLDQAHELVAPDGTLDGQGPEQVLDGENDHADGGAQDATSRDERDARPDREQDADAFVDAPLMICVSYAIPCPSTYPLQCCHSDPCVCCTVATSTCP